MSNHESSPNVDNADLHDLVSREFDRQLSQVASDLRAMADRLDDVKSPKAHQPNPGFGVLAASVVSDIMNMLPNLGLSMVVNAAQQADTALLRYRAKPVMATPPQTPTESAIGPGSYVRDVIEGDYGVVSSVQEGGFSVIWELGGTPKFAADDEVEPADSSEAAVKRTRS